MKTFPWPKRIAAVVPRYAESLGGGAEALTKALLEHMAASGAEQIDVLTTCALDHRTWANALAPGEEVLNGITVRRFLVDERDLDVFIGAEHKMRDGMPLSTPEQLDWMASSVNSSALYDYLAREGETYDVILFAPYLFATTFWGSLIHPERSVLIPCLHNEHYAYQDIVAFMFARARGLIFNAEPEQALARQLFGGEMINEKSAVVGMGFEKTSVVDEHVELPEELQGRPYILYAGRKEQGKNLDLLLDGFTAYRESFSDTDVQLVVTGSGTIDFCDALPPGVIDLGFVSEELKVKLMREARALCQPSVNESFSIVLMEAWLANTPVIVHGKCPVTRHHVVASGGGLYFSNITELIGVIHELVTDDELCDTLGKAGADYVARVYNWDAVLERLYAAFESFGLAGETAPSEQKTVEQRAGSESPRATV